MARRAPDGVRPEWKEPQAKSQAERTSAQVVDKVNVAVPDAGAVAVVEGQVRRSACIYTPGWGPGLRGRDGLGERN